MTQFITGVGKALESGRIGFTDTSITNEGASQLFKLAPTNQVFIVPNDRYVAAYKNHARSIGRCDITFKIENVKNETKRNLTNLGLGLLLPIIPMNLIADVPLWTNALILTFSVIFIAGSRYGIFGKTS